MPPEPHELHEYKTDHDLLLELRVEMRLLREDIKEMKNGIKITIDDHETRIRGLEKSVENVAAQKETSDKLTRVGGAILIFAVGVIEFLISQFYGR